MPPDERVAKAVDRCAIHPGRARVAACAGCGRALCIACAVPVRGVAYGPECLGDVLGDDVPVLAAPKPTRLPADRTAGVAILVALAATIAPWTRFGTGSGWLQGAWSTDPRWSMLAAIGALAAAAAWWTAKPGSRAIARRACLVACVALVVGSMLAIVNPPPFTKPAPAPWIALVAGLVAIAALLAGSRIAARPAPERPVDPEGV